MLLSSIVVSRDPRNTSVLESILSSLHINVEVATEFAQARAKLAKSKIDALIVDSEMEESDGLLESGGLLTSLGPATTQGLVPMLICKGTRQEVPNKLAEFLLRKPITVTQAVRTLSSARNMIVDRRLRYHRQTVDIETSLISGGRKISARMLNLSQGGAGLKGNFADDLQPQVKLNFSLPRTEHSVELSGEIVWIKQHQACAGVQFKDVSHSIQRQLQIWLEQRYFSH
jgi:CheY-like chemotaxis protein